MTSIPQASISYRSQPNEAIASTTNSAGCPASSIARRIAGRSLRTELAVSVCTPNTPLILWALSADNWSRSWSGSIGSSRPKSSSITSIPMERARLAQPPPNVPLFKTNTCSPGSNRLLIAASQTPCPLQIYSAVRPWVPAKAARSERILSVVSISSPSYIFGAA